MTEPVQQIEDLDAKLNHLRGEIERVLEGFLAEQRAAIMGLEPRALDSVDEVGRLVAAGGRRIRPLFCYWGHRSVGGEHSESILNAAAAMELLHTMALIHDDVMDRTDTRRGAPTVFRKMADRMRQRGASAAESDHFGISAAVLAGDLAFVLSDTLLVGSGFPPAALGRAATQVHEMRVQAIAGQWLDISTGAGDADHESAARIARLKTASYSVRGPLLVGAALAGAAFEAMAALSAFGSRVGEALQLRDDLAGVMDPSDEGGDPFQDLRTKSTHVLAEALSRSPSAVRQRMLAVLTDPAADRSELASVREAVRASGALEATENRILQLVGDAKLDLELSTHATLDLEAVRVLNRLADIVAGRSITEQRSKSG